MITPDDPAESSSRRKILSIGVVRSFSSSPDRRIASVPLTRERARALASPPIASSVLRRRTSARPPRGRNEDGIKAPREIVSFALTHSFIRPPPDRERERQSESDIVVRPASSSSKQTSSSTRANVPFRLFGELRLVDEILARERAEVLLRRPDRHGRPSVSAGRDGTPAGRDESTGTRV